MMLKYKFYLVSSNVKKKKIYRKFEYINIICINIKKKLGGNV